MEVPQNDAGQTLRSYRDAIAPKIMPPEDIKHMPACVPVTWQPLSFAAICVGWRMVESWGFAASYRTTAGLSPRYLRARSRIYKIA